MRPLTRRLAWAGIILFASLVCACGATSGPASVRTVSDRPSPVVQQSHTVSGVTTFEGVGARISPAPADASPAINATQAQEMLAQADLVGQFARGVTPQVQLVTYTNLFGATGPDGTETPSVPSQLAWFATYRGLPNSGTLSLPGAPRPAPTSPVTQQAVTHCTFYAALSGTDGRLLDSFRFCGAD